MRSLVSAVLPGAMDILTVGSVVIKMAISLIVLFMLEDRLNIEFFFFNTMVEIVELSLC